MRENSLEDNEFYITNVDGFAPCFPALFKHSLIHERLFQRDKASRMKPTETPATDVESCIHACHAAAAHTQLKSTYRVQPSVAVYECLHPIYKPGSSSWHGQTTLAVVCSITNV